MMGLGPWFGICLAFRFVDTPSSLSVHTFLFIFIFSTLTQGPNTFETAHVIAATLYCTGVNHLLSITIIL